MQMLEDASIEYEFVDVEDTSSPKMAQIIALTGEKELPQLFIKGVSHVGKQQIREHIRK